MRNEAIRITDPRVIGLIEVTVVEIGADEVHLGVECPADVPVQPVHRREIFEALRRQQGSSSPVGAEPVAAPPLEQLPAAPEKPVALKTHRFKQKPTLDEARKNLGAAASVLKQACDELNGLTGWPYKVLAEDRAVLDRQLLALIKRLKRIQEALSSRKWI